MSEGWVNGLPPAAVAARMQRMRADGVTTSFLSVGGAVAASSVGIRPLRDVMGCTVAHIGWRGWGGCRSGGFGRYSSGIGGLTRYQSGAAALSRYSSGIGATGTSLTSFAPYADAVRAGYLSALNRLRAEAQALGAHGVIGVTLTASPFDTEGALSADSKASTRDFLALGTAVTVDGAERPPLPFLTLCGGAETAQLMAGGWVPSSIALGLAVAVRHDDYRTTRQASSWLSGNTEVDGYTTLVQHAREAARADFARSAGLANCDGALLSVNDLRVWEVEPADNHIDHVAEAFLMGTTVAQFHRVVSQPTALSVLPLRNQGVR